MYILSQNPAHCAALYHLQNFGLTKDTPRSTPPLNVTSSSRSSGIPTWSMPLLTHVSGHFQSGIARTAVSAHASSLPQGVASSDREVVASHEGTGIRRHEHNGSLHGTQCQAIVGHNIAWDHMAMQSGLGTQDPAEIRILSADTMMPCGRRCKDGS